MDQQYNQQNVRTDHVSVREESHLQNRSIDTNLYSRQIGTYGMEAMRNLVQLEILLYGMDGLGVEIAKNVILSGPKRVSICDKTICTYADMGSNFFIDENGVKSSKTRAEACLEKLAQLNDYVNVDIVQIDECELINYDICVAINQDWSFCKNVGDLLHNAGKKFIACGVYGLAGYVFVDMGTNFKCSDTTGEECKSAVVSGITQDKVGTVTLHGDRRAPFQDGDYVLFKEVLGMEEINQAPPMQIKITGKDCFTIGDTMSFSPYLREGIVSQVKVVVPLSFDSFRNQYDRLTRGETSNIVAPDLAKFDRPEQLFFAIDAVEKYRDNHNRLPEPRSREALEECLHIAQQTLRNGKKENENFSGPNNIDDNVLSGVCFFARCIFSPNCAFFGGVVAQEILKISGKFHPLKQWLFFDCFEIINAPFSNLKTTLIEQNSTSNFLQIGSRYDHQICIWGKQFQDELSRNNMFLVGAGALGCEFLKSFALLGICCSQNDSTIIPGTVTVTDMDSIEISNLNRQFLFRKNHIGLSKSTVAADAARMINKDLNVSALEIKVGLDSEDFLDDHFWNSQSIIVNALDNIQARKYIDGRCVWYEKPLLESGTLGPKGNTQVILPFKTQSYSDSNDPPEDSIPLCTLKHFPFFIEHTIEWARDMFHGLFTEGPLEAQKIVQNPELYFAALQNENAHAAAKREKFEKIKDFLMPPGVDEFCKAELIPEALKYDTAQLQCVAKAVTLFHQLFCLQIKQLLYTFPENHISKDGRLFWTGPKRCPRPVHLDMNDSSHRDFVVAASNLFANTLNISPMNVKDVVKTAEFVRLSEFKAKTMDVLSNPEQQSDEEIKIVGFKDDETAAEALEKSLKFFISKSNPPKVETVIFEKDNDLNSHVKFIHAAANLRARNYSIEEASFQKCKMIAGKIIPAIATTTAMITGLVCIEVLKAQTYKMRSVEEFKNSFVNLALPLWILSEPLPPIKMKDKDYDQVALGPVKARPLGFSRWDKIYFKKPDGTVKDLLDFLRDSMKVEVSILFIENACIYNSFLPAHAKSRLDKPIHKTYEAIMKTELPKKRKFLGLEASCVDIDSEIDVLIPVIRFEFRDQ